MKDFFTFATLIPININFIKLYSNYSNVQDSENNFKEYDVYFKYEIILDKNSNDISKFLFKYDLVSEVLSGILNNWFDLNSDLHPILGYLIESIKPVKHFTVNDFLNIIQALEGFHRRFRKKKQTSLISRLNSIYQEFSELSIIKEEFVDRENILRSADSSRHYYTHFFEEEDEKPKDGIELFQLTKKLKILLICCVLKEVGFENDVINNILTIDKFR